MLDVPKEERLPDLRLINLHELTAMLGSPSRTSIWRWVRSGHLPPPIRIGAGGRLLRWRYQDIAPLLGDERDKGSIGNSNP
jgi:predicted DNA-binding transcriptional regulator AlpA